MQVGCLPSSRLSRTCIQSYLYLGRQIPK